MGQPGLTRFFDTSAGSATLINEGNTAPGGIGGATFFAGAPPSRAGNATIHNLGARFSAPAGVPGSGSVYFFGPATAEAATITNFAGGESGLSGGYTAFDGGSAGTATITHRGGSVPGARGGWTLFYGGASASNATLVLEGGTNGGLGGQVLFNGTATALSARAIFMAVDAGDGTLDISGITAGTTIGSIEGTGRVLLGSKNLNDGLNNLSTEFSGVIADGGTAGGVGGAFQKWGTGRLTLSGDNTYSGSTTIVSGELAVRSSTGMGLGTGIGLARFPDRLSGVCGISRPVKRRFGDDIEPGRHQSR